MPSLFTEFMSSLFTELRRRNVFKVGAAYAIVAWLLIQIVDVVLPALQMPEWTISFITVLLMVGFHITLIMAWAFEMTPEGIKADADVPRDSITPDTGQILNYVILGLVVLAVGFLVVDQYVLEPRASLAGAGRSTVAISPTSETESSTVQRFSINLGAVEPVGNTRLSAHVAISPDGRQLVYAAQVGGKTQLYHRELDELETRPIRGTEGAFHPFFSPDGEWVAFYIDQTPSSLKRVSVRGGPPQNLADTTYSSGGSWELDDTIIYGTGDVTAGRNQYRISANGGLPETLLTADDERGYVNPEILPGGAAVLLVARPGPGGSGNARDGSIAVLMFATGEVRTLIEGAFRPQYAPTGHIVFVRDNSLWAVPFNVEALKITGAEIPLIEGVQQDGTLGGAAYAFSEDGILVYVPSDDTGAGGVIDRRSLVWVDR